MEATNNSELLTKLQGLTREALMDIVKIDIIQGKGVPVKNLSKWRKNDLICLVHEFLSQPSSSA
jgi:hypothetical protein